MKIAKLFLMLSVALWVSVPAFAQDQSMKSDDPGKKMKHEEKMTEMKAAEDRLDKLAIDMNTAATPEKKLDAAIAVLNEIVAQHKKMHEKAMNRWEDKHEGKK